jgi:hypothetical protein
MPTRWPPGATYQIMSQWACKATQCAESHSQLNLPLAKRKPSERGGRVELPPRSRYCVSVALDSISNKRKTRASNLTDLVCTWKVLLLRERLVPECLSGHLVSATATTRLRSVSKRTVDRFYVYPSLLLLWISYLTPRQMLTQCCTRAPREASQTSCRPCATSSRHPVINLKRQTIHATMTHPSV